MKTTEQLNIKIPALKRPTLKALQKEWSWIRSIERDISTEKACVLNLATVLEDGENSITGSEYEKRFPKDLLGFQHREWLIENQDKFPKLKELLGKELLGKVYIDFPALIVVYDDGNRLVPYAGRDGKRWYGYWNWLGLGFSSDGRFAVPSKSLGKLDSSDSRSPELLDSRVKALEDWREHITKTFTKH